MDFAVARPVHPHQRRSPTGLCGEPTSPGVLHRQWLYESTIGVTYERRFDPDPEP